MTLITVTFVGALGAVARYALSGYVQRGAGSGFPWGTLVVNISGAFALGLLIGSGNDGVLGVGFLAGFTTYSTWMVETVVASPRRAVINVAVSLAGGIGAAYLGLWLGSPT